MQQWCIVKKILDNRIFDTLFIGLLSVVIHAVDKGRKLNVHKTLRRRPGRLLNVLCTFNLRPVSTGTCISFSLFFVIA